MKRSGIRSVSFDCPSCVCVYECMQSLKNERINYTDIHLPTPHTMLKVFITLLTDVRRRIQWSRSVARSHVERPKGSEGLRSSTTLARQLLASRFFWTIRKERTFNSLLHSLFNGFP